MEGAEPMDRLVFGDVGFGKTEVAMRAAMKAVQNGKQVAMLVPTTLLAQQHHATLSERFDPYPVRVEALSRFLTGAEQRRIVDGLGDGSVDIVIGTHRLLSGDIRFEDLGLLVVDEEQRFGVAAKDQIKRLRTSVDVLTLTATPIPRTLEMALTGIRQVSHIRTAPVDRHPILTYVGPYDEQTVSAAIRRELLREGQVFYVHNRVQSIDHALARLRALVPYARYAVAHGQMSEGQLEQVMVEFWNGEHDVLVATTIIESGLDLPQVNTLIVERADRARPRPAVPAAGAGGPVEPARLRLPVPSRRRSGSPMTPTAGWRRSAGSPSSARVSSWRCATWRSAGREAFSARPRRGTSPRSGSTCTSSWSPMP